MTIVEEEIMLIEFGDNNIEAMYLTFQVEGEEYAVKITHVTEIVGMQKISEVPDVPGFIRGVINLRGQVIPVMDARLRFGLTEATYSDRTPIIVLELNQVATGLIVDQVNEVLEIPEDQITPPPRWHAHGDTGIISGLGKRRDGVSIILNVPSLLNEQLGDIDLTEVLPSLNEVEVAMALSLAGET